MITFGPVPSRRLGRSLGINNIPPKMCSYSCVYCQVGRTLNMQIERFAFYEPESIVNDVRNRVKRANQMGKKIDYLTFVPDGEPTLDIHLGKVITLLKPLGIKIAVITNGSLLWREDIRESLMNVDWISLKVDSAIVEIWRKTDRPHGFLQIDSILEGMLEFKKIYHGELVTESMLIRGFNDGDKNLYAIADFLYKLQPARAYLSIPTRPPAENWVLPSDENVLNKAFQIFNKQIDPVEYLIGYEGTDFASTGRIEEDLLSITSVHPMREDAVKELLQKSGTKRSSLLNMVNKGQLIETKYEGRKYYLRRFP